MDQIVTQLVDYIQSVPLGSIYVVYLIAAVWLLTESMGIGLPIEPMMLVLGAIASQGKLDPVTGLAAALGAAVIGTLAGASLAYLIGLRAGNRVARAGRFVGLTQTRVDHMELWLRRRGALGVVLARFVPVVRGFSPYVLGASGAPVPAFLLGTLAGALIYDGIWTGLGFTLGNNYEVALRFFDQFGLLGLVAVVAIVALVWLLHFLWVKYVWRRLSAHFHRHRTRQEATAPLR